MKAYTIAEKSSLQKRFARGLKRFASQRYLQLFAILGIVFLVIFCYIPMAGLIIAFKNYKISTGFAGFFTSDWAANGGFKHFIDLFKASAFPMVMRNTIVLSLLKLVFSFPAPIIFAIALNEVRQRSLKKVVQTVSYLPHFISWVVVYGLVFTFLNTSSGVINRALVDGNVIPKAIDFLASPNYFWALAVITDIWKELGWWSIIFLAAIAGIDPSLYEAATADGANRLRCIWHVTLPSIRGTIMVVLILAVGGLMTGGMGGSNFEQSFLMGNKVNYETSAVLGFYVYETGLVNLRYSYATAAGLFQSLISLVLVFGSNYLSKKTSGYGLF
jgi:putative aldouronate transport system permease protein